MVTAMRKYIFLLIVFPAHFTRFSSLFSETGNAFSNNETNYCTNIYWVVSWIQVIFENLPGTRAI